MKLKHFLKTIVVAVAIAVCLAVAGIAMTGCGEEKPDNKKEIQQAVSAVLEFLENAKKCDNYSSVSQFPDGSKYEYYAEGDKIKVDNNEVFYIVKGEYYRYKISQADDTTWHKTLDNSETIMPAYRIDSIINSINKTSKASLWTDYDSKTKTLTATYSDGKATVKLDDDAIIITYILDTGTTVYTINKVGTTTVTLPENIIDDTQN